MPLILSCLLYGYIHSHSFLSSGCVTACKRASCPGHALTFYYIIYEQWPSITLAVNRVHLHGHVIRRNAIKELRSGSIQPFLTSPFLLTMSRLKFACKKR